jgi:hypothetical protein
MTIAGEHESNTVGTGTGVTACVGARLLDWKDTAVVKVPGPSEKLEPWSMVYSYPAL